VSTAGVRGHDEGVLRALNLQHSHPNRGADATRTKTKDRTMDDDKWSYTVEAYNIQLGA
jgi:hypothetical protein